MEGERKELIFKTMRGGMDCLRELLVRLELTKPGRIAVERKFREEQSSDPERALETTVNTLIFL